ncbi:MAG: DUF721 domain-containing protein [Deltaproteobacteria bacterium]|jgi:hypothetical protein|nr:DUF721 domain-containing protein [Deltaproteobacteria bacterium]
MSGNKRFNDDPVSLEELIRKSLNSGSLYLLFQNNRIFGLWPRVTGEAAKNSEPYLFQEGILYAWVTASVYLDKYRYQLKEWVERYRLELGAPVVEEIRLRLGKIRNKENGNKPKIEPLTPKDWE